MITRLIKYLKEPLRRNSLFLMGTNVLSSLVGFVFWLIAARHYSAADVGLATAIVAIIPFLAMLATVGFDFGLVRFLPATHSKSCMINTCLTITALLSVVTTAIYLAGMNLWSPDLLFVRDNWGHAVMLILLTMGLALSQLLGQVFVAFRATHFVLFQSIAYILRPLLLIPFVVSGIFGIVYVWGLPIWLMVIAGVIFVILLLPGYRPRPTVQRKVIGELARFSAANYISRLLIMIPMNWMPLIIIAVLSEEASAYFYIPFSIANLLSFITGSVRTSFFAEASNEPSQLRQQVIKATKFIYLLLIPMVVILFAFGRPILSLYDAGYIENSLHLLWLFAVSGLFNAVVAIYGTILRVQLKIRQLVYISAFSATLTLLLSYFMMKWLGLIGVGIARVSSEAIVAAIVGFMILKMVKSSAKNPMHIREN